jgi:hypothetical protein
MRESRTRLQPGDREVFGLFETLDVSDQRFQIVRRQHFESRSLRLSSFLKGGASKKIGFKGYLKFDGKLSRSRIRVSFRTENPRLPDRNRSTLVKS